MARYIEECIGEISEEDIAGAWDGDYPSVMVVGPDPFKGQVFDYLSDRMPNVSIKASAPVSVERSDAIRILAEDPEADLGWRIVSYLWPRLNAVVKEFLDDESVQLHSLVPVEVKVEVLKLVDTWKRNNAGDLLSAAEHKAFEEAIGSPLPAGEILDLEPNVGDEEVDEPSDDEDRSRPRILCTSFQGSKGLSADIVFVVGLNEGHFPRKIPSDVDVMCLLVALTRTRKQCHLVSCGRLGAQVCRPSCFVEWLKPHIDTIEVNKGFFE